MSDLEELYGPSWRAVVEHLRGVEAGVRFDKLGCPHQGDDQVLRITDWDTFRERVDYVRMEDPDSSEYLSFLAMCHGVGGEHGKLLETNGLQGALSNGLRALHRIKDQADVSLSREYTDFVGSYSDREKVYPYWEYSLADHRGYALKEAVVAHLTACHLLRDMWRWYVAGHWPCGWEGEWPNGRLIVF